MLNSVKALVVVLLVTALTFRILKPVALQFSTEADFLRRRNVWFAMTALAFLSPSFWIFAAVSAPVFIWLGRKDSNAAAVYVMFMQVIPPYPFNLPSLVFNDLFSLDIYRLLSFCVLLPAVLRWRRANRHGRAPAFTGMDYLVLAYGAMQVLLWVRPDIPNAEFLHDSPTNMLRRGFLFIVDVYWLYYVVSRTCASRGAIREVMAAFWLSCVLLAPLAELESLRHWSFYQEIGRVWSGWQGSYLERGGTLRAFASAGHPLALGYLLAIALGFWLYLSTHVASRAMRLGVTALLGIGLLAAYSRGPWVGAALIYVVFLALGPRAISRLVKSMLATAVIGTVALLSPLGDRIIKVIPFLGGTVDSENIGYRQRLAQRSWEMITQNPLFGDQEAYSKLDDLRQGQGMIDFVNFYAAVAVFQGLIELFFFVSFILVALYKAYSTAKRLRDSDPDFALLGVSLSAGIVGTLMMISTCSMIFGYEKGFYLLAGLAAAYARVGATIRTNVTTGVAPRTLQVAG